MTTASTRQATTAAAVRSAGRAPEGLAPVLPLGRRTVDAEGHDALHQYVDVMIADRCRRPADDLISKLIELEVDGEDLTVDDIRNFVAESGSRSRLAS